MKEIIFIFSLLVFSLPGFAQCEIESDNTITVDENVSVWSTAFDYSTGKTSGKS